jgi:hypothetical protein
MAQSRCAGSRARRLARRRLNAGSGRCYAHEGAGLGADGGEAPRRASGRRYAAAERRVGVMRSMLSPALVALNRDAFIVDETGTTNVDLAGHGAASSLDDVDLDEPGSEAA